MSNPRWPDDRAGAPPSVTAPEPGLPEAPQPQVTKSRRPQWLRRDNRFLWTLAFTCSVVVTAVIAAAILEVPYFALRPGSVHNSAEAVRVDGVPTFAADGSINYTTVSIKPVKALDMLFAWLDGDVDIRTRREILGDRDADENRELNRFLMDDSQEVATKVALETLGFEVDVNVVGELVHSVQPGMPADGVVEPGDVILEVDGERVDGPEVLRRILNRRDAGDEVELLVASLVGDAEPEERTLTLAEDPETGSAYMGVVISPLNDYDFPFEVAFDIGDIGGPSAGLAFSLALVDMLTEGDLTGGLDVAVTGAIGSDGQVLSVGGTGQKAAAARSAGMALFLVPASGEDYDKAVPRAGDMEVVKVATIQDALTALAERGGDPVDLAEPALDAAA